MKRLLTLSIILGFIFPGVFSEETGWNYKQTTLQSFYMFDVNTDLRIDGEHKINEMRDKKLSEWALMASAESQGWRGNTNEWVGI